MKKLCITFLFLFLGTVLYSQTYPTVSIRDIQFKSDSALTINDDISDYVGDTVRVVGIVMVAPLDNPFTSRKPIMWAGARWQSYLADTSNSNVWIGLNVIQDDTTTHLTGMELLDSGQVVAITGIVSEFGTTYRQTQINVLRTIPIEVLGMVPARPEPKEVLVSDFANGTAINLLGGEKYEGQYVIIKNVTTSNRNLTDGTFTINDASGNQLRIHDQSAYFTRRSHKIVNWEPPIDGTVLSHIRGVIGTGTQGFVIRPMLPGDVQYGTVIPPSISSISRDSAEIKPQQQVKVYAKIIDIDGQIVNAKVNYRVNGGASQEISMSKFSGDTIWVGTIPGVTDSSLVDYFVKASDNGGNSSINPTDTSRSRYFYLVLNRPLSIADVQYAPWTNGLGGYINQRVSIRGVVTADTSDLRGDGNQVSRRVYIQDGRGPWTGIWVRGANADNLRRGDLVNVSGKIVENNSHTCIDSLTQLTVVSSGNPLPLPVLVASGDLGGKSKGTISAEQWEGVLIKLGFSLTVTRENSDGNPGPDTTTSRNFGEFNINDGTGDLRVELQEGNNKYHNNWSRTLPADKTQSVHNGDTFVSMAGILFYSFSNYKLVPRKNDDFDGFVTDVQDELQNYQFALSQNYPNPFNPSTTIEYTLDRNTNVSISVYDLLGREIKKLVNDEVKSAGKYNITFDGSNLSSGIYLYQIKTAENTIIKKMVLMK